MIDSCKVSVIVPVYNAEKYLRRCIDSIRAQTFTDFELLLVDDGSTDTSGKICDEYAKKDNRIRVFHKENGGVSSARNVGLDNAKGEWICFCDADDWVSVNWMKDFSASFSEDVDFILAGFISVYDGKEMIIYQDFFSSKEELVANCGTKEIWGYLWCKCFKQSIINKYRLRFNVNFKIWEDASFIYEYAKYVNKFEVLKSAEYIYNRPDFTRKYVKINKFDCCIDILQNIDVIAPNLEKHPKLYEYYLKPLFSSLFKSYACSKHNETYLRIKQYLQIISKYPLCKVPFNKIVFIRNPRITYSAIILLARIYKILKRNK